MALVDFDRDAVDAAIRFGLPESFHCESLPLAPCRATVVGSAKLLADNPLRRPEDVAAHTLIHVRREPNDWQIAARWAGLPEFKPRRELYLFDDFSPLLAASRGQGLAFALLPAACNWLLDGRLTTPFPWAAPMEQSYFYAFRRNQKPRRGLMEFYHWVREVFEGMAARCPL
jgi:LysR family glycine cleavage system transcriptional activator